MVMLRHERPYTTYEVYDENGNSVGCVILPKSRKVIGRDQPTVLLRRPNPRAEQTPHISGATGLKKPPTPLPIHS